VASVAVLAALARSVPSVLLRHLSHVKPLKPVSLDCTSNDAEVPPILSSMYLNNGILRFPVASFPAINTALDGADSPSAPSTLLPVSCIRASPLSAPFCGTQSPPAVCMHIILYRLQVFCHLKHLQNVKKGRTYSPLPLLIRAAVIRFLLELPLLKPPSCLR
jgi:hypothetical protein